MIINKCNNLFILLILLKIISLIIFNTVLRLVYFFTFLDLCTTVIYNLDFLSLKIRLKMT